MYSSLYLVTPCLLVERFANQKKTPQIQGSARPRCLLERCSQSEENAPARAVVGAARGQNLAVPTDDVEQPVGRVVDLQGRVLDPELLVQDVLELAADAVAVLASADEHVRGEGGKARADLPDVEVVDVGDALVRAQGRRDLVGRDALRRSLEEHASAAADERPAGPEHG